ncbi:MAG: hypothetical protein ABIS01_06910, partial [Ferruginibacter sp.]
NEFIFLSLYFYHNITINKKKNILVICISAFLIFCFVDSILYGFQQKNSGFGPLVVECLFFLIIILYYFYERMKFVIPTPIYKLSSFWISVAFLIYFSGTFLLFLASNSSMVHDENFVKNYNIIYGSVAILKNLLIVGGIFVHRFAKKDDLFETISPDIDLDSFQPFSQSTNLPGRK